MSRTIEREVRVTGERFRLVEERFESVCERLERVEERLEELRMYADGKFEELKKYVDSRVAGLGRAFSSHQEFLVGHLAARGVTSESEVALLKSEARRLAQAATLNPFTREEWERLKRYLDEDTRDFTL